MTLKMSPGITENDVWTASDALLLEGARPTIERVRQKIGRGSPNTVSPYLDTWFRSLGGRIGNATGLAAATSLPDPVRQAAEQLWEAALGQTRHDFEQRLQEAMAAAVSNVEAEKERASLADAAAFDAVSRASRLQSALDERNQLLDEQRLGRASAEAYLADARRRVDDMQTRLDGAEAVLVSMRQSAERELAAAAERSAVADRRAMRAIDIRSMTSDFNAHNTACRDSLAPAATAAVVS